MDGHAPVMALMTRPGDAALVGGEERVQVGWKQCHTGEPLRAGGACMPSKGLRYLRGCVWLALEAVASAFESRMARLRGGLHRAVVGASAQVVGACRQVELGGAG